MRHPYACLSSLFVLFSFLLRCRCKARTVPVAGTVRWEGNIRIASHRIASHRTHMYDFPMLYPYTWNGSFVGVCADLSFSCLLGTLWASERMRMHMSARRQHKQQRASQQKENREEGKNRRSRVRNIATNYILNGRAASILEGVLHWFEFCQSNRQ